MQIGLHAERFERKLHAALVQKTHDDAFAVQHRDHRHADVDLAARNAELDAAVLRQALFGDVEPGHDLQPADDRGLKAVDLRRHRLGVQHAVDAVADLDAGRLRLDVHVARPRFDRLEQDFVHQPDDRRFLGFFGQLAVDVDLVEQLDVLFFLQGHQVVDRFAADAQVGLDLPGDLLALGQHGLDREAGRGAQLIERVEVERVAGGDAQRAVLPLAAGTANGGGSA